MKTSHEINNSNPGSQRRARVQSFMAVAGVMIAVVCGLVLFQGANVQQQEEASDLSIITATSVNLTNPIAGIKVLTLFN